MKNQIAESGSDTDVKLKEPNEFVTGVMRIV